MAYRGARGGPKSCRLGRVTQVDQARAQVGVHRYLPEVSGVRIKWVLAYLKEDGSMTASEGSRPALETVSVKEVITKVDLNKDGVLAASSARKLDKAGYSLQERTAVVAPAEDVRGGFDLADAFSKVLVAEERPQAPASAELLSVRKWAGAHLPKECLDVLEVSWGEPVLSRAARQKGYSVGPAIVHGGEAYGARWDLLQGTHIAAVNGALDLLRPRLLVVSLLGKSVPQHLFQFVVDRAVQRREYLAVCFTAEDGEWKPWTFEGWGRCFGTLSEPNFPWGFVRADNCQFVWAVGKGGPLAEKSCFWLSDFSLSPAGLRCGKPDALGNVPHDHGKEKAVSFNLQGAAICAALPDIGLRGGADSTPEGIKSLPAAAGSAPAPPQPVPEMPLPDVRSGEDISPVERAKLDKEVESYAQEMEAFWKAKADARDWDSVPANLEVYALAGEKVTEDPRRTEAYRDLVWEGLKVEPGPTRPGLTAADVAAIKEVVRRKAAGFWAEGTTRTTVRKFAHDCIPTGPPVSSQPHALKGEAAQWVDDRLEEEVQRGQLVRGPSAWGSAPFPTKKMPNHKRARKRRLVVDYRRVNARVKRSTYYCRRSTDVLAAAVGSIWYTFVDAVSGFNQIRNTKRAREVLAIVARSGKYLPVGLTFGPVNGPDDFNFVVDRAYAPGKGRRLRYTKEWIAYVDDLTVRTGRVVDGKFYTDSAADQAVREACAKGSSQAAPQSPESAMEALGFKPKPPLHDAARSDTNHPTRAGTFRGLESGGFQGCGFKGFGAGVVRGLFAALWKGARGGSAALVCDARWAIPRCSVRTRGGSNSLCRPCCLRGVVRSSRRQCECRSAAFCVGVEGRRSGGVTLECPAFPLGPLKPPLPPQQTLQLPA